LKKGIMPVLAVLLLFGCATSRIKPVESTPSSDLAGLKAALERYNGDAGYFKILGTARIGGGRILDLGARGATGAGSRLDVLAGPASKLLLSAGCVVGSGCTVFFPDDFMVYRDEGKVMASWFTDLVTGRVPLIGAPQQAGKTASGEGVLLISGRGGQWQTVLFAPDGVLPRRTLYGDGDGAPRLEISYSDFISVDGLPFPGRLVIGGEREGEELVLDLTRVERQEQVPQGAFGVRLPSGTGETVKSGREAWKKLGMFWTPRD